tara:strand:+ start:259 stop:516 length:258 start_codon:yes stop_codon:yes gene_type:complete
MQKKEKWMKEILKFLKWQFNIFTWSAFTKRLFAYFLIGIGLTFLTEYGMMITLLLLFTDFTVDIFKDRWDEFKQATSGKSNDEVL